MKDRERRAGVRDKEKERKRMQVKD